MGAKKREGEKEEEGEGKKVWKKQNISRKLKGMCRQVHSGNLNRSTVIFVVSD